MDSTNQLYRTTGVAFARILLGIIFFWQGFGKVFQMGVEPAGGRFRHVVRMAPAGLRPRVGTHGPDHVPVLRHATFHLGRRLSDRRLFGNPSIFGG